MTADLGSWLQALGVERKPLRRLTSKRINGVCG